MPSLREFLVLASSLSLAIVGLAHGQDKPEAAKPAAELATPKAGHSMHGEAFNDGPRQKAYLMPGMGKVDFPVSTKNAEAQAFFNQGVAQLHTFFYLEAERSFRQASRLDPAHPMPYWGMAMANTNNADRAKGFLKTAREKAKAATLDRRETLYLEALEAKYAEKGDAKAKRQNWLKGLETIVQDFPNDLDARAWLAMVTWENSRQDGIGSRQAVHTLLESILAKEPMHPGAHHYTIHLWDGFKQEMAVDSAAKYAPAAPGIAHAWHMPGHTYTGLKRYPDAAYQQEGSARVDHAYMIRDRVMPFEIHNYAHNNQWLSETLIKLGRARDAVAVARDLVEQPRDPKKNEPKNGGSAQRSGRQRWMETLVTLELWDELDRVTRSGELDFSSLPYERVQKEYALGLAAAGRGDRAGLATQIQALRNLAANPPEDATQGAPDEPAPAPAKPDDAAKDKPADAPKDSPAPEAKKDDKPADTPKDTTATEAKKDEKPAEARKDDKPAEAKKNEKPKKKPRVPGLDAALAELEGYALLAEGKSSQALARFSKASMMRPEALARAHLAASRLNDAIAKARDAVLKRTNELAAQATLVEILDAAGHTNEARTEYEKFLGIATHADAGLPALNRLARIAASWKARDGWEAKPPAPVVDPKTADRIPLDTVGPLTWSAFNAETFELADTDGQTHNPEKYRGKNLIVLFYLGGKCAHCMQQLEVFSKEIESLRGRNAEILAISTDTPEASRELKQNPDKIQFRMPILSDPSLDVFRRWHAYDDFEQTPLHGTFLIDPQGKIRFQNVSFEPFLDIEFLKTEVDRVNRLTRPVPPDDTPAASGR